jgi:ADP-ribosyl-[dinitrogen reductase] hydrolase
MFDIRDHLRGIAVGAAVGDALGMPLEFKPPRPEGSFVTEMIAGPLPAGYFTDDTEMALCLAESLLLTSPLDEHDLAGRFTTWLRSHPSDVGIHTARVLNEIISGEDVFLAAQKVQSEDPDSAGNGSLMRAWPIAIARYKKESLLISETNLQSVLTHTHPDAVQGTLFFNLLLYHILQAGSDSPQAVIRLAIQQSADKVLLDPDFAMKLNLSPMRLPRDLKNTGWIQHTLESALWAIQTTLSFEEALVKAVNLGYDADTTGAVTGAIAGALYGLQGIPARWRQFLHGEYPIHSGKLWFENDFIRLADQLAAIQ